MAVSGISSRDTARTPRQWGPRVPDRQGTGHPTRQARMGAGEEEPRTWSRTSVA